MKIEKILHEGVDKNGIIKEGGAVGVDGDILVGRGQGCGLPNCHCSEGYWLSLILPRSDKGVVEGVKVVFANKQEMDKYLT
jgi:hypothetical protein